MSAPKKYRRDALLVDPTWVLRFTDRRGREWVTDRFTMVRADLFARPVVKDTATGHLGEDPVEFARRVRAACRRLIRGIRWADTAHLMFLDEEGADERTLYRNGALMVAGHSRVCQGYGIAGLTPRLHLPDAHAKPLMTWWKPLPGDQRALMAVLAPKVRWK